MNSTNHTLYNFVKKNQISKSLFISYSIAVVLMIYFFFSSIFGEKGLIEFFALKNKSKIVEIQKNDLQNKIQNKKEMIKGMNLESLDLDLVDEQSRKVLGYVGKDEVVIYENESD